MMILGPFLNVIIIVLTLYAFVRLIYTTVSAAFGKLDDGNDFEEDKDETNNFVAETMQFLLGIMFPVLLNFGFCATSGIFLLQPVLERETKIKQMLLMSGMSNFFYWIGLFLADLILMLFPFALFCAFVLVTQIEGFYEEIGSLMIVILSFGSSLIPLVYLLSTCYKDSVTATKCIAPILIVIGNVAPLILAPLIMGIASITSKHLVVLIGSLIYIINPFATFFANSYTVLVRHFHQ